MIGRKWRLILGWLLFDLAAIALVVWQFINIPERRTCGVSASSSPSMVGMAVPVHALGNSRVQLAVGSPGIVSISTMIPPSGIPGMHDLTIGTTAKDFTLPRVGEGPPVHLADLRGKKPVVVILSSFTCNVFCGQVPRLEKLYCRYRDRAEFVLVVVKEAKHTIPGLEFLLKSNSTLEMRRPLVARALKFMKVTIPTVLDTDSREVEQAYSAFPMRLVVVNPLGKLTLDARFRGEQGLDLDTVTQWLEENLPESISGISAPLLQVRNKFAKFGGAGSHPAVENR